MKIPQTACYVGVSVISVSLLCTIFQLFITSKIRRTGFTLLISSLAVCNIVYDIGYYFNLERNHDWGQAVYLYLLMFSDISMGIWTNAISSVLVRIVYTLESVDIFKEYPFYLLLSLAMSIPIVIYTMVTSGYDIDVSSLGFRIYYWIRLGTIILNAVQYGVTKCLTLRYPTRVQNKELTAEQAENIRIIVRRMRYFGAVQVISRLGLCWSESSSQTYQQTAPSVMAALLGSCVGILYFILFVYLQPAAYEMLMNKVLRRYLPALFPPEVSVQSTRMSRFSAWNDLDLMDDEDLMGRISTAKRIEPSVLGIELPAGGDTESPMH